MFIPDLYPKPDSFHSRSYPVLYSLCSGFLVVVVGAIVSLVLVSIAITYWLACAFS